MPLGGGYVNRVAWIDLTGGKIEYKPIAEEDARKYIGARGLGVKYVFDNGPQVDPLSPENILCFMNGPLTGTDVNMSGRLAVVTKSPLTGTVTDSPSGRLVGGPPASGPASTAWSSRARPRSRSTPTSKNGKVDAARCLDLWGKGIHETIKILQERHGGEKDLSVIAIGPAGENLVRFACWMNENDRAVGPRRHRLRRRQQEPEGHRHQGASKQTAQGRRSRKRSRPRSKARWRRSWTSASSPRRARAGCRSTAPTC